MIARLTGRLIEKGPNELVIEAGGVGYRVCTPLSTFCSLPPEGSEISLRIHTHVREDALALYGFSTRVEQELFERLIEISGIGPRLALSILSGLQPDELIAAISTGDGARLRRIPGVGPRTADRVILEMRDRVRSLKASSTEGPPASSHGDAVRRDVVSALVNLGYQEDRAEEAVIRAEGEVPPEGAVDRLQDLLKRSLRHIGAGRRGETGASAGGR
jgi:Holliday junction DNA helicase RuvA